MDFTIEVEMRDCREKFIVGRKPCAKKFNRPEIPTSPSLHISEQRSFAPPTHHHLPIPPPLLSIVPSTVSALMAISSFSPVTLSYKLSMSSTSFLKWLGEFEANAFKGEPLLSLAQTFVTSFSYIYITSASPSIRRRRHNVC